MITLVEALKFRCLRFVRTPLGPLQILVGPNASGKTTFLDVISFLGTVVSAGPEAAMEERTRNPLDLLWERLPGTIELAIEAKIPQRFLAQAEPAPHDTVRYELALSVDATSYEYAIVAEKVLLKVAGDEATKKRTLFPEAAAAPHTILTKRQSGVRFVVNKVPEGNDNFYSETYHESGKGWVPSYRFGPKRSALGNLPADESRFPVATWLKDLLTQGVQQIMLNSLLLRQASPPGHAKIFRTDGSNLPWVIQNLKDRTPALFEDWIAHLQTALPDLESVRVVVREDDRHSYLLIRYRDGLEAPSWVLSDGTLRLLALTILAYLPDFQGIYLIEEPENGIHPTAIESLYESLSSVYEGQVLLASHSPVLLALAQSNQLLCFSKTPEGGSDIIRGDEHPKLRDWRGEVSLGTFFASGILD